MSKFSKLEQATRLIQIFLLAFTVVMQASGAIEEINCDVLVTCYNGGTCLALYDGAKYISHRCNCVPGFTGKLCETNIDECASRPCINGLCTDLVNSYNCSCFTGWEGSNCDVNHNDCPTNACLNGGRCLDGNGTYSCDCSRTGFNGSRCEVNIDDCQSNSCQNGATCQDLVNGYSCKCFDGYFGEYCANETVDCTPHRCLHNGTCLERSDQSNYENSSLPPPFNGSFSYPLASGFVCLCPLGAYGDTCEINPNDCLIPGTNQSVCVHASSCTDGLASFTCHCLPGYEGKNCSQEIDECRALPPPCPSGATCIDLLADFECANCPVGLGGRKCSVNLTGCNSNGCQNGATCEPILEQEVPTPVHDFQCVCESGWAGRYCNTTTLASFSGTAGFRAFLSEANDSSGDWSFELSFRTSLTQFDLIRLSADWGDIRIGAHNSSLMLLFFNASSSVIGQTAWPISDSLTSADWLTLSVSLTNGSATLTPTVSGVRQPQTQLVKGLSDTFKRGQMSVDVGGERGSAIDGGGFRGCVRDLRLVTSDSTFVAMETTVESGNATWGVCSRSVQCGNPSPCEAKTSSMCSDLWNDFVCHCAADFGGRNCSVELPSFSFGVGGNASSASFTSVPGVSSVYGGDSWTIEMKLVTLSRGAFLMLLGDPSDSATTPRLLVTINSIGDLHTQLLHSNGSQIAALTSPDSVATGSFVSVKIFVSISGRELSLSVSSAVRSASLSSGTPLSQLSGQLIIGGFSGATAAPPPFSAADINRPSRTRRSAPMLPSSINAATANMTAFRGVLRSIRANEIRPLILGPMSSCFVDSLRGAIKATYSGQVALGNLTEDVCSTFRPCKNEAMCINIFYSCYVCVCRSGYSGRNCSLDFPECAQNPCGDNFCCFEKSDAASYNNTALPSPFNGSFSYSTADGFVCLPGCEMQTTTRLASMPEATDVLSIWTVYINISIAFVVCALLSVIVFSIVLCRHKIGQVFHGCIEKRQTPEVNDQELSQYPSDQNNATDHEYRIAAVAVQQSENSTHDGYIRATAVTEESKTTTSTVPPEEDNENPTTEQDQKPCEANTYDYILNEEKED